MSPQNGGAKGACRRFALPRTRDADLSELFTKQVPTLFGVYDLPINIITVVICAILGVLGWALVLIFHLLGIAF